MTETPTAVARNKGRPAYVQPFAHKELRPLKSPIRGPVRLGRRGPLETADSAAALRAKKLEAMRANAAAKGFRTTPEGLRILISTAKCGSYFVLFVNKSGVAGIYALQDENEELDKTLDLQQHVLFRFLESRDYGQDFAKDEMALDHLYDRMVLYWSNEDALRVALDLPADVPLSEGKLIIE